MKKVLFGLSLLLVTSLPATAQGVGSLTLPISLPGPLGITGSVTVSFENVSGLTPESLNLSSQLVSLLDPILAGRLPAGTSLLSGFPVLVRIEPTPAGGLSFKGAASVEMVTSSLTGQLATPCIFSAPLGGAFQDITTSFLPTGPSNRSYRAQGAIGGFSEFLVLLDATPVDQVVGSKLDRLDQILAANTGAMPQAVHDDLAAQLTTVRSHSTPGGEAAAIQDLDNFIAAVKAHSGTDIPDVWRSARDLIDVAGQLRAGAATLQHSLRLRQGAP